MTILYMLIPLGLMLVAVAIWAFMWAVRTGQLDDMEGSAHRFLMDDDSDPRIPGVKSDQDKPTLPMDKHQH